MQYSSKRSRLSGRISIPASKSHTMRAILFASLAHGKSAIFNYLASPDTIAMKRACEAFGACITPIPHGLEIIGVNGKPRFKDKYIDVGNSGQVFRFIAAIAALDSVSVEIDGDASIRHLRPIKPLLQALSQLSVKTWQQEGQQAPICIQGPMRPSRLIMDGQDSQPVSALLMACSFLDSETEIVVNQAGETPWIDLTLDWLKRLGIGYDCYSYEHYRLHGKACYKGFDYHVPGDFSSLAFPLLAAIITQSELSIDNLDFDDVQGDKKIVALIQELGIPIVLDQQRKTLKLSKINAFDGFEYDMNQMIDALPVLAVLACFARSPSRLFNASIARNKECDRIKAMYQGLTLMGAKIEELADGLRIYPSKLHGADLHSYHDHRIAMAFTVAGLAADGLTIIDNVACIEKSYPEFLSSFQKIGALIE